MEDRMKSSNKYLIIFPKKKTENEREAILDEITT